MNFNEEQLRAHLRPGAVTSNLLRLSLATTLHSLIKVEVVEKVRDFFSLGFDGPSQEYFKKVRTDGSEFADCLNWLVDSDALNADDLEAIDELHQLRGVAAHEGARVLVDPTFGIDDIVLAAGADVLRKLGVFWGRISIDTNPAFDDEDVDDIDIQSGLSALFDHVLEVTHVMMESGRMIDSELASEEADTPPNHT